MKIIRKIIGWTIVILMVWLITISVSDFNPIADFNNYSKYILTFLGGVILGVLSGIHYHNKYLINKSNKNKNKKDILDMKGK